MRENTDETAVVLNYDPAFLDALERLPERVGVTAAAPTAAVLVSQGSRNHPRATRLRRSRMYRVLSPSAFRPRTTPRGSTGARKSRSRCYGRFAATRPGAQQEWRTPPT
jgi:hypothetical protein